MLLGGTDTVIGTTPVAFPVELSVLEVVLPVVVPVVFPVVPVVSGVLSVVVPPVRPDPVNVMAPASLVTSALSETALAFNPKDTVAAFPALPTEYAPEPALA